jgi:simple sugar transport system ATP-binding protein
MSAALSTHDDSAHPSLLELHGVSKSYGPVLALDDADFQVRRQEIVGLLGDNGAGKSTLIKIMSGVLHPDCGTFFWQGAAVQLQSRRDSEALGIETIYQDSALVDSMSVWRNFFAGREITGPFGLLQTRRMRAIADQVLQTVVTIGGIGSPDTPVGELSGGQKQAVAIARAVHFKRNILLLDEPTSALAVRATEAILEYIRALKHEGVSSVLVTHNLYHAYQVCDRFVVMGHGRVAQMVAKEDTTVEELTKLVVMA